MSFSSHIDANVSKASQRLGLLFRGFISRDLDFLRRAFITYIRPLLEYNSVVWSPTTKKDIDAIEQVQRRFTKRVPTLENLDYLEWMRHLNLQSLELHRLMADLVYYYKVLNGLTPYCPDEFFLFHEPPSSARQYDTPEIRPRKGNKCLFSLLQYRSVDAWNSLPQYVNAASSPQRFKHNVSTLDLQSFIYGSCYTDFVNFNLFSNP